jgi:hypothetical protein
VADELAAVLVLADEDHPLSDWPRSQRVHWLADLSSRTGNTHRVCSFRLARASARGISGPPAVAFAYWPGRLAIVKANGVSTIDDELVPIVPALSPRRVQ